MTVNGTITLYVSGVANDDLEFIYGSDVSPDSGCAVTLRGRMLYLGGDYGGGSIGGHQRQVRLEAILQITIIYF